MTKRQFLFICVLMVWSLLTASANDGVYFTSGNFLVPTQETDISVSKEILTITIGKDNYARVDVYYEFTNSGAPKTVTMAFEADAPYNLGEQLDLNGAHPFIHDFTVNMNGNMLRYDNAIVALFYNEGKPDSTSHRSTSRNGRVSERAATTWNCQARTCSTMPDLTAW